MIKVTVIYIAKNVSELEITGHAQFADSGKDIVCAGVSAISLSNLMYAQKNNIGTFDVVEKDGYLKVRVIASNPVLNSLLEAIIEGCSLMEMQFPNYIKVIK